MALGGIGYNKYHCQLCENVFSTPGDLKEHIVRFHTTPLNSAIHGDVAVDTAAKWCSFCNKWISREDIDDLGHPHFQIGQAKQAKPYKIDEVSKTLAERAKTYGNFAQEATYTEALKRVLRSHPKWELLPDDCKLSLEMQALKMIRAINCFTHADNWHDISGYAKLVEDRLNEQKKVNYVDPKSSRSE